MDEVNPKQQTTSNLYERMSRLIYSYHFGRIGYLDLLKQFEEMLGIAPPQNETPQEPMGTVSDPV